MPAPLKTTTEDVLRAAADVLEAAGPAGLTMQAVAARVGVRAPSLYKRFRDRGALLARVRDEALSSLGAALRDVDPTMAPAERLAAFAYETRAYATRRPQAYALMFTPSAAPAASRSDIDHAAQPLRAATRELVGPDDALHAARTLTAWLNGFIAMEQAGAFQLDPDVEGAFRYGLAALVSGLGTRDRTADDT